MSVGQASRQKQKPAEYVPRAIRVQLPTPHESQSIFTDWNDIHQTAQVLVAPCGTKTGKSFGSAIWLAREAMVYSNLYCLWVAPTLDKAKIGYRYVKSMLPEPLVSCSDTKLEIRLANNSFITFTHGREAEVTIEGEAVDRFVIDEAGKQRRQLWYSTFTTITQTRGLGIITGTPRGLNWYSEIFRKARAGDPFFCWAQLPTECSPFVSRLAIKNAKRILPPSLFAQYYLAQFISDSDVFGDLSSVWKRSLVVNPQSKIWFHPDNAERAKDCVTGVDVAKKRDYTVFITTNHDGIVVGYWRFKGATYPNQGRNLQRFLEYFKGDKLIQYDSTGVGEGFGDIINEMDIDASFVPVTFTNRSKEEMVTRTRIAIETNWWKCPYIEQISHEFGAYELNVSKSGLHTYAAGEGEHDDCVSAAMLSICGAFHSAKADRAVELIEQLNTGKLQRVANENEDDDENGCDDISAWANASNDDMAGIERPDHDDDEALDRKDELSEWESGSDHDREITHDDELEVLNTLDD